MARKDRIMSYRSRDSKRKVNNQLPTLLRGREGVCRKIILEKSIVEARISSHNAGDSDDKSESWPLSLNSPKLQKLLSTEEHSAHSNASNKASPATRKSRKKISKIVQGHRVDYHARRSKVPSIRIMQTGQHSARVQQNVHRSRHN